MNKQRGVAALEFSLVFTLVFGIFWALVSYTFPLIMLQAMNRAVAEGARVGAGVNTRVDGYQALAITLAREEVDAQMRRGWLPAAWVNRLEAPAVSFIADEACTVEPACVLQVTLRYPGYINNPIIPIMSLPVLGQIPRLPTNLVASARLAL